VLLLLIALNFALQKLVEAVMIPHAGDPEHLEESLKAIPKYVYVDLGRAVIVGSLGAVMAAVAYYYLRGEKEGTSAQDLAKVFE
jgi:hypothetical protein